MQYVLVFSDPMHLILWSGHISSLFDGSAPRISVIVHPKEMSPAVKIPLRATRMSMILPLPSCLLLCTRSNVHERIHPADFTRRATRTLMWLSNMSQRLSLWALKYSRSCSNHIRCLHASSGHVDMCQVRFCDQHSCAQCVISFFFCHTALSCVCAAVADVLCGFQCLP